MYIAFALNLKKEAISILIIDIPGREPSISSAHDCLKLAIHMNKTLKAKN